MQIRRFLLCLVVMVATGCSGPKDVQVRDDSAASTAEKEALIHQLLDLIDERKLDAAFQLYAEDYIYHGPGGQELRGRDGIRGLWDVYLTGFPDLSSTVEDMISQGDKLVLRWTIRGTHTGEFLGVPASNRKITLPITEIFRIADGQFVEAWDQYDRMTVMQQIGAIAESSPVD